MTPRPLTARQAEVLGFIQSYIVDRGRPPTMREIGARFGITSNNGVNDHLRALVRKGAIRREALISRSIVVVASEPVAARPAPSLVLWPAEVHP